MATEEEEGSIGASAPESEQRGMPRCAVDVEATLVLISHGAVVHCRMVELGMGGCRMVLRRAVPQDIHAIVEAVFKVRGIAFRLSGLIEWTSGWNTLGISFAPMSSRRRDELLEALCEVEAENAAKAQSLAGEEALAGTTNPEAPDGAASSPLRGTTIPNSERTGGQGNGIGLVRSSGLDRVKKRRFPLMDFLFRKAADLGAGAGKDARIPVRGLAAQDESHRIPGAGRPPDSVADTNTPLTQQVAGTGNASGGESRSGVNEQAVASGAGTAPATKRRERRADPRYGVDTSSVITLVKIGSKIAGHIVDLSLGGCRIHTVDRFPVGIYTRVEIEFRLHGMPLLLGGVIQAIHDRNHIGIRFLDVSPRKREQVALLIEELEEIWKAEEGK